MHSRYVQFVATCVVAAAACAAAPKGPQMPPTPPPPLTPPPPVPTAPNRPIDAAEREYDRTIGRMVDQPTHELDQIQSPPSNDLERIEREQDRQEMIDRQQHATEQQQRVVGTLTRTPPTAPPYGTSSGVYVGFDEDRQGLEAEVLEAAVAYERGTRQADAALANDPQHLQSRRRELGGQLEHQIDVILSRYAVRRIEPATRPATP